MNDERLNRLERQERIALRTENSQLKRQMAAKDSALANKDGEILRLLNQIASDMVKRDEVDSIVKNAVAEEHDRMVSFYEQKMKDMAAEYEAKIAALEKKDQGHRGGNAGSSSRKKPGTLTFNTKEEAVAALEEANRKALVMADQAFGGGSEKLTAEQKPAVDPQEENADDDTLVKEPIEQRGNYGQSDYEPIPRPKKYCNYGEVDEEGTEHEHYYPEGAAEDAVIYGERTVEVWEVSLPRLYKKIRHLYKCLVNGRKVWAKTPNTVLGGSHMGSGYTTYLILNKYLNGTSENRTERALGYQTGMKISRKTPNSHINRVLNRLREIMEKRFHWWITQDPYLAIDETIEDVFTECDDGRKHLRRRYLWGMRASLSNLVCFIYDKGSRSRKVILDFLEEFFGTIQTDGATMYKIFEKDSSLGITRLACLVHIRRYFIKALKFEDKTGIARRFLDKIMMVYKLEKSYRKDGLSPEQIQGHRKDEMLPLLDDIWMDLQQCAIDAEHKCGTLLIKAINYAKAEWAGIIRYTQDGTYRCDNNYAEQCMRDIACGRKNFLFSGSDEAAKNLAFAYSLTQSCKMCKIDPYEYWHYILDNAMRKDINIDSLMPHIWHK